VWLSLWFAAMISAVARARAFSVAVWPTGSRPESDRTKFSEVSVAAFEVALPVPGEQLAVLPFQLVGTFCWASHAAQ